MEFPDSIEKFGYAFSSGGRLLHVESGEPFVFEERKGDHPFNQARYEALGNLVTEYVYNLLEERCKLERISIPVDAADGEPTSFIFCSKGFELSKRLLVLIHGSGVVRAGQWARRLIINDCLDSGTQIPYIERALKEGCGIVVFNTNDNERSAEGSVSIIRGSESPLDHGIYVWEHFISKSSAAQIGVVAHSYGGEVTCALSNHFKGDFEKRVFAIALTDSVHTSCPNKRLLDIGRNWVSHADVLDTPVKRNFKDIPCVSAGCMQHEMTSWSSFNSIFKFFEEKLKECE